MKQSGQVLEEIESGGIVARLQRDGSVAGPPDAQPQKDTIALTDMGRAAAVIAHELRQPLSTIQHLTAYLKTTVASADDNVSESLDLLQQEAELAGRILSNLVAFTRSGKPQKCVTQIHRVVEAVLSRIEWNADICLNRNLARGLPPVFADPLHIDRIVSNLITNALESMDGSGTLWIATRAERDEVVLQVTDTGCGIEPAQAETIFTPFITTKPTGTGLGLALCRQLAEANGGSITFESESGEGTTFELRLPRAYSE